MIAVVAALLFLASASSGGTVPNTLAGEFSSAGASFVARADGSRLTLGCADASIAGPVHLDGQGRFSVTGEMQQYAPGPQMVESGQAAKSPPVRLKGRLSGRNLELTVLRPDVAPETLHLTRGPAGKMVRCL